MNEEWLAREFNCHFWKKSIKYSEEESDLYGLTLSENQYAAIRIIILYTVKPCVEVTAYTRVRLSFVLIPNVPL